MDSKHLQERLGRFDAETAELTNKASGLRDALADVLASEAPDAKAQSKLQGELTAVNAALEPRAAAREKIQQQLEAALAEEKAAAEARQVVEARKWAATQGKAAGELAGAIRALAVAWKKYVGDNPMSAPQVLWKRGGGAGWGGSSLQDALRARPAAGMLHEAFAASLVNAAKLEDAAVYCDSIIDILTRTLA